MSEITREQAEAALAKKRELEKRLEEDQSDLSLDETKQWNRDWNWAESTIDAFAAQSLAAPDPRPVLTEEEREAVAWAERICKNAHLSKALTFNALLARSGPCKCAERDAEIARMREALELLNRNKGGAFCNCDLTNRNAPTQYHGGMCHKVRAILGGKEGA